MARALGWVYIIGPALSLVSFALAFLPYANFGGLLAVDAAAIAVGVALLSGRLDTQPSRVFEAIVAAGTVAVSLAVYFAGTPSAGFRYFYLWVIPYAWRFFSRRAATAHTAFAALSSGVVLAIQVHQQGRQLSEYYGLWIVSVITMFMIGIMVERLTASLRLADERFHRGFLESPIGLVLLDSDVRILELNPAFAAILERHADDLVGHDLHDHIHVDDRARGRRTYQAALDRSSPVSFQERYVRSDGAIRTVSVHAHPQQREAYMGKYLFCQGARRE